MKKIFTGIILFLMFICIVFSAYADTPKLTISGNDFINQNGEPVRFWGFNVVSLYPTHTQADEIAEQFYKMGVNVVRPHHVNRDATYNWNYTGSGGGGIGALIKYDYQTNTTRTPNADAYEKFDYFNMKLKEKGIYTRQTLDGTRSYLIGDVDIITTTSEDKAAWQAAMKALNELYWEHARDLRRMLPTFDERVTRLNEEFMTTFLTHENQYTNITYAKDPQTLTLEVANETSAEYSFIAGNRFISASHIYPKKSGETDEQLVERTAINEAALVYWSELLNNKWKDYLTSIGVTGGEQYSLYDAIASSDSVKHKRRSDFLRKLDEDYFNRVKALVRDQLNCDIPITFSTFWRGDTNLNMHVVNGDYIEEHSYSNPLAGGEILDLFGVANSQTKIDGMPYFLGELNQPESAAKQNIPARANLILATAAYGSFNNWTGVNFFSWNHGDDTINSDGSAKNPYRAPVDLGTSSKDRSDMIGNIQRDQMMLDHMRTAGIMYKQGLVQKSNQPKIIYIDEPYFANGYSALMTPKYKFKDGWQSIHAFFRSFTDTNAGVPAVQKNAPWMLNAPQQQNNLLISDTNEIFKNINKKQLLVNSKSAEGMGGITYAGEEISLNHLEISSSVQNGSATVIMVSDNGKPLKYTDHIIISSTATAHDLNADVSNVTGTEYTLPIKLKNHAGTSKTQYWQMEITRPADLAETRTLTIDNDGAVILPTDIAWNECELTLKDRLSYSFEGAPDGLNYNAQTVTGNLSFFNDLGKSFEAIAVLYKNNAIEQVETKKINEGDNTLTFGAFNIPRQEAHEPATVSATSYTDMNLKKNTSYEYEIQAYNGSIPIGEPVIKQIKTLGDEGAEVPDSPSRLYAENINATSVTLSWSESPASGAVYNIYRNDILIAENINALTYTDAATEAVTAYTYAVTAVTEAESLPIYINITTISEDNLLYSVYKDGAAGEGLNLFNNGYYSAATPVPDTQGAVLEGVIPAGTKTLFVKAPGENEANEKEKMVGPNINWQSTATGAKPTPVDFTSLVSEASLDSWINIQAVRNKIEIGLTSQAPDNDEIYHLRVSLADYIGTTGSENVGYWKKWQHFTIPLSDLIVYGNCYKGTAYTPEADQSKFDWQNILGFTIAVSNESSVNACGLHDLKVIASSYNPPDIITVNPPSNVDVTDIKYNEVTLTWTASSSENIDGYRVYRNETLLTETPITRLTYTDAAVIENTVYTYTIKAVEGRVESVGADKTVQIPANRIFQWRFYDWNVANTAAATSLGVYYVSGNTSSSPTWGGGTNGANDKFAADTAVANNPDVTLYEGKYWLRYNGYTVPTDTNPNAGKVAFLDLYSGTSAGVAVSKDLSGYKDDASLKLYMNFDSFGGNAWENIEIGLINASARPDVTANKTYLKLPVSSYISNRVTGSWYELQIPLSDFEALGKYYIADRSIPSECTFDWTKVIGITFSTNCEEPFVRMRITDMKIEQSNVALQSGKSAKLPAMALFSDNGITKNSVNLTWEAVPGADSYKITRRGGLYTLKIFIWDNFDSIKPYTSEIRLD